MRYFVYATLYFSFCMISMLQVTMYGDTSCGEMDLANDIGDDTLFLPSLCYQGKEEELFMWYFRKPGKLPSTPNGTRYETAYYMKEPAIYPCDHNIVLVRLTYSHCPLLILPSSLICLICPTNCIDFVGFYCEVFEFQSLLFY